MQMNEVNFDGAPPIDGYGEGFFRVANAVYRGPLAMMSDGPAPVGGDCRIFRCFWNDRTRLTFC